MRSLPPPSETKEGGNGRRVVPSCGLHRSGPHDATSTQAPSTRPPESPGPDDATSIRTGGFRWSCRSSDSWKIFRRPYGTLRKPHCENPLRGQAWRKKTLLPTELLLLLIRLSQEILLLVLHLRFQHLRALQDLLVEHLHVSVLLLANSGRVGHARGQRLRRHHHLRNSGGHFFRCERQTAVWESRTTFFVPMFYWLGRWF